MSETFERFVFGASATAKAGNRSNEWRQRSIWLEPLVQRIDCMFASALCSWAPFNSTAATDPQIENVSTDAAVNSRAINDFIAVSNQFAR
jgi:hypothetical protein